MVDRLRQDNGRLTILVTRNIISWLNLLTGLVFIKLSS